MGLGARIAVLSLANANQRAIPHDIGVPGFWLVGDTTWPGLGTVACVLGSRIVSDGIVRSLGGTKAPTTTPQSTRAIARIAPRDAR